MKRKILRSGVSVVCVLLVELLWDYLLLLYPPLQYYYYYRCNKLGVPSKYGKVPYEFIHCSGVAGAIYLLQQ